MSEKGVKKLSFLNSYVSVVVNCGQLWSLHFVPTCAS